ncbi:ribosomal-protein-alanine N-acetyltransferase [Hydrogenivirga caldilitoris]|uniref:[Ribosomal protein bS18]-alanine N-acetyltransferase n=1 Tax=Hydrogenivirga caldilitoris TaxID=246264 RepID=A0A497XP43_9AQUI|nr:ribosomal protein S18-alanine N-acetyltransferase [Hydrogenivirga caldilitoris]RLJ70638.1 ribosomal-protein-alanine N-acetyltransferase [Hydrogenivirga caldilitoris]
MDIHVRYMTQEDLPRVYEINRLSFTTDAWSLDSLKREFNLSYSLKFVLEVGGEIVGYAILWLIKEEAFIMTFAIAPKYRGKGIGKLFLSELIDRLRESAKVIQLDVRKSNLPAIKLYRSLGFKIVRERPKFYSDGESALVMELEL